MSPQIPAQQSESRKEAAQISANSLFLLDTMGYIFRAYHALPRLTNREGLATQAVYGLNSMLKKLLADYRPEYLAAVFDLAGPTFRHESFADYKANRAEMPDELAAQLPYIHRLLAGLRIPELSHPGYEADDVIGTIARQAAEQNRDVIIVTADKDMLQLVGEHVGVLNPMKDDLVYDRAKVRESIGLPPEQIPDYMALMGDSIDNIPGAPGIGPKGAQELIQKYGSVEACLDHAEEVARKTYRESLQQHREQILMSKALATIDSNAPVPLSLDALRRDTPDSAALRALFQELGFTSLLKDLPSPEPAKADYAVLSDDKAVREFLQSLGKNTVAAFALGSVSAEAAGPAGGLAFDSAPELAIAPKLGVALVIPPALFPLAKAWLEDAKQSKAVHDSKNAKLVLERNGVWLAGVRHDTFLYSYLLDATEGTHNLASVVERRLGAPISTDVAGQADGTAQLAAMLEPEIREQSLEPVYKELDLPVAAILAEMERTGIRLDRKPLDALSAQLEHDLEQLRTQIYQLTGTEFNINSPRQLGEVLFEKMALPAPRRRGKSKAISTAIDVLEELAAVHEVPRRVLEYRQLAKLKSTYVDALPAFLNPLTGRLHTSYNQAGSATGRLSSSNPNLQNIPIRTELGRQIRAAFVADPGWVLLAADYSQIELRLLAHFSEDPLLVEAFRRDDDIHALTAATVFGVEAVEQTSEHRRRAKAINYGIVYGISPFGLAQQLDISQKESAEFIDNYFSRYEGVAKFIESTLAETRRTGQVRTLFGRLRRIPDMTSRDPNARGFAERTAVNTPLQGSAADLIKLAMIHIDSELRIRKLRARMILQVHDELVLEAPEGEVLEAAAVLRNGMENCYPLKVPLVASVAAGPNWRDMEDVPV